MGCGRGLGRCWGIYGTRHNHRGMGRVYPDAPSALARLIRSRELCGRCGRGSLSWEAQLVCPDRAAIALRHLKNQTDPAHLNSMDLARRRLVLEAPLKRGPLK